MGPKKRNRRSYNCGPCKKHKIKCDMRSPCGNCAKYGREKQCLQDPPNPPTKEQLNLKQERRRKYLQKKASSLLKRQQLSCEDSPPNSKFSMVSNSVGDVKFNYDGNTVDGYLSGASQDNSKLPPLGGYQYLPFQMQGQSPISHIMYQHQFIPHQQGLYQGTPYNEGFIPSHTPGGASQVLIAEGGYPTGKPNNSGPNNSDIKWNIPNYQMPPPTMLIPSTSPNHANRHQVVHYPGMCDTPHPIYHRPPPVEPVEQVNAQYQGYDHAGVDNGMKLYK